MEVAEAIDGRAALDLIRARPPAVIVTDVQMPRLDGLALSRLVRADATTRGVPIVIVSSYGSLPAFAAEARDAGCDVVLSKPCAPVTLCSVVRMYVDRAANVGAPPVTTAIRDDACPPKA